MNQWEAAVIEVIAVTGSKDSTEAQRFRCVILVRVTTQTGLMNG